MPLNPNIALQVKGLEVPNPLAQMAQVTQIENALQQQRMGDIQMQNALREQRRKGEFERILGGFGSEAKATDIAPALVRGGFLTEARTLMQSEAQLEETRRKAEEARLKGMISEADIVGRVLGAAKDQASYDFAVQKLSSQGIFKPADVQFLGPTYDPARVKQILDTTLSQKDRLEAAFKERTTVATETKAQAAASQAATAAQKAQRDRVPMSVQEFEAFNRMTPDQQAAFTAFRASQRPTTTVTTTVSPGEKAEETERGKLYVAQQKDVGNAATAARKSLVGIQSAQDVITRGFDTGFLTETKAKAASVLAALGVADAEKYATDAQKFLQAATERVLAAQLDQKGVQTNQDAQRIEQAGARMGNTKAANEFILDVARAQAERAIAHDKFYRDWLSDPKNNNSLRGAEDAWLKSEGDKSIFESPRLKKYGVLAAERMQTTPAPQGPVVGGRSATPRGAAPSGPQPPAAAVQSLLRGEGTDEQFDAVFGPGAAARARGR
jgi:hypothetical protein